MRERTERPTVRGTRKGGRETGERKRVNFRGSGKIGDFNS